MKKFLISLVNLILCLGLTGCINIEVTKSIRTYTDYMPESLMRVTENSFLITEAPLSPSETHSEWDISYSNSHFPIPFPSDKYIIRYTLVIEEDYKTNKEVVSKVADIYDATEEMNQLKSINLVDVLREYDASLTLGQTGGQFVVDNQYYQAIDAVDSETNQEVRLYMNIETGEITEAISIPEVSDKRIFPIFMSEVTNYRENIKKQLDSDIGKTHITYNTRSNSYVPGIEIIFDKKNLPAEDSLLYELYPELKGKLDGSSEQRQIFYIFYELTDEQIVHLMLPVGADPYEGLYLYPEYSKSGEKEAIYSAEDFLSKYKSRDAE